MPGCGEKASRWRSLELPDEFRAEFTGERVIPGQVEDNLFNEHLARYRFAAHLWQGAGKILDAGCGTGYGTAELALSGAEVLGIDVSEEAVTHARTNYARSNYVPPNIRFEQASCAAIPAETQAFRLITAFEVIEHVADWRGFLREAYRVLDEAGMFLVSTPNKLYYAESRQKAGPNPFHVHEFTEAEFRSELAQVFPQVKILLQNHVEGIAFSGEDTDGAALEISDRKADPDGAHFFLAVCGKQPLPRIASFVFIPESGNVLQTRERHIALLDGEILKKNQWIEREQVERQRMLDKVREMEAELEEHNQWAQQANVEAERRARLVAELQAELQQSNEWAQVRDAEATARGQVIERLQQELAESNEWAQVRDAEAVTRGQAIERLQQELAKSNEWAQARDAEAAARGQAIERLQQELAKSNQWALDRDAEAAARGQLIERLQEELRKSNEWAQHRDAEAVERGRRVEQLQGEVAQAVAWAKDREAEAEERSRRIEQLQDELGQSNAWALAREAEAEERGQRVVELQTELERATEWAKSRDAEAEERGQRIVGLQEEYARLERDMAASRTGYEAAIEQWQREKQAADQWAMDTERRLSAERDAAREAFAAKEIELRNSLERLAALQADAEQLRAQLADANDQMDMIAQSRWVRLGRTVRIGPEIHRDTGDPSELK